MAENPTQSARKLPLHRLHQRWGARFVERDGVEVPAAYITVEDEVAALREGCALADRSNVARLELMGEDRQRFLNGLVTVEVKDLASGRGGYGYFTDRQGKILADTVVLAFEDRLWLELPPGAGEAVRAHLEKYIIADRIEVKSLDDLVLWCVAGPRARDLLAAVSAGALPDEAWSHVKLKLAGSEVEAVRQARLGVEAWTLWTSASIARAVAESLVQAGPTFGLRSVGDDALSVLRVEEGIPRFGADFGPENFPQEVGEDGAVSYTKGCYLGQEIVARIHYRGGVNYRLVPVGFEGATPGSGTPLLLEEREVGTVRSVAVSPRAGAIGLAMIHKRGWDATQFATGGGVAKTRAQ